MQSEIDRFLDYLRQERNSSDNTTTAYRTDLQQFLAFLQERAPVDFTEIHAWADVNPICVQAYLANLQKQDYASSTVARKLASVKSFFSFMRRNELVSYNPARDFRPPPVEKTAPVAMDEQEISRLLQAPGDSTSPKAVRDKALLETLYATGMRVSELIQLDVNDAHLDDCAITCGEPGRTRRTVPIYDKAVRALRRYTTGARPALGKNGVADEEALFLNHRGSRLTRQGLWLILRDYAKKIGIETPVTPLTLRHSFASHLLNSGADLKEVQERLGHASTSTTQTYQDLSENRFFPEEESTRPVRDSLTLDGRAHPRRDGTTGLNGLPRNDRERSSA